MQVPGIEVGPIDRLGYSCTFLGSTVKLTERIVLAVRSRDKPNLGAYLQRYSLHSRCEYILMGARRPEGILIQEQVMYGLTSAFSIAAGRKDIHRGREVSLLALPG